MEKSNVSIQIRNARENNLKSINVDIPLRQFVVITGISGSGKSSLAFDVIVREGQRRYLESVSGFARRFTGKLSHPKVDRIENLPPVIAVSQKTAGGGARSTLGTMSDLYDYLRLLFARIGASERDIKLSRALFSFNSSSGACPHCTGLGLEEKISIEKLIADPTKSLRDGALAPTLPTGYIMYTQLTMDSMDILCRAHGFSVDIPWNELTEAQQEIVLYGSNKLKVPIGKHSLESRLKWEGIAAKPREEDYYKGIINIMTDILRRDRNQNILKYAESLPCSHCQGTRLNENALSVIVHGENIAKLSEMELTALKVWLNKQLWTKKEISIAEPLSNAITERIEQFEKLGMGHLSLKNPTEKLSVGDIRRIRLINQIHAGFSDVLYVFDEAFVGLHPHDHPYLIEMMRELVSRGNTVMLVEHDESCIRQADYIVDIGPAAGKSGGEVLFSGTLAAFLSDKELTKESLTAKSLQQISPVPVKQAVEHSDEFIALENAQAGNLKSIHFRLKKFALNVLTGLSGSGKNTLIYDELLPLLSAQIAGKPSGHLIGAENIKQVHHVSRHPIGRTPRSNPATYTKLSDALRDLYAAQESAKSAGLKKSHFSFNTKGGRCETCLGAGKIQIGMHFLGNVDLICPDCHGKRFKPEILTIKYNGKSISEVYDMTINQAIEFFVGQKKLLQSLESLQAVGLGYLSLGQSSTTLSGGEAQRVKLAAHLKKAKNGNALFILDEPASGLHHCDIQILVRALKQLMRAGNTILCIAHNRELLANADYIIELGHGRGKQGGVIVAEGNPTEIMKVENSFAAKILDRSVMQQAFVKANHAANDNISLKSVTTHNLKGINLDIPKAKMTVIAGVSGSGKSSLAFDTIVAEAESRFNESMSAYARSFLQQANPAEFESISGLTPVMALSSAKTKVSERSTVGTMTGLYDYYRLLFSRIAQLYGKHLSVRDFSFNHQSGACPQCNGLGMQPVCNPDALITNPELSIAEGALKGSSPGRYFGNPDGQFVSILSTAAKENRIDISSPYQDLSNDAKQFVLYGSGDREYELDWHFKNKSRSGVQHLKSTWPGFCYYIEDEFRRKHQNKTGNKLSALMHNQVCSTCQGMRLKPDLLQIRLSGKNISELSALDLQESVSFFQSLDEKTVGKPIMKLLREISPRIIELMQLMLKLGIGYLSLNRRVNTLSGGEMQRVSLAGALASPLYGVTYVLDEPSSALHRHDIPALIEVLKAIKERGNTLILLEHEAQFMRAADYLIELGPGAGKNGGEIVYEGEISSLMNKNTPTANYLKETIAQKPIEIAKTGAKFGVKSASANNLKNIDVEFQLGGLIAISGISGSGKSSLVRDVIIASLQLKRAVNCDNLYGFEQFKQVKFINQQSIYASAHSSVFTAAGLMDALRDYFAKSSEAKAAGLKKSAFSYVHKDGKCPECNGQGVKQVVMDFMSDVDIPCDACDGYRYKPDVLKVRLQGKHIGEVLQLPLAALYEYLDGNVFLQKSIQLMMNLGLGHLSAGQSVKSLSAGEKQRIKLLSELIGKQKGSTLFIMDEPAAGLHYADILRLIDVFKTMIQSGHTLLLIEHRPEILQIANQQIVLGPGAGKNGGSIVSID
ncbi:MAG: ATP-binding cassette domain-containing protein [Bacteroidota bacterium]|nr:ATP-binding cassette domain-containing protein [Bacteroidota bacterium]